MAHQDIWQKVLNKDEEVKYSFSVSDRYARTILITWVILWIFFALTGLGFIMIFVLFYVIFYYGFYIKKANAYAFTNKRVVAHVGFLSTRLISLNYSSITDVYVGQTFFGKLLTNTGYIAFNTPGSSKVELILKNIDNPYEVKKKLDELRG